MTSKVHTWYYCRRNLPRQCGLMSIADRGWTAIVGRTLEEAVQFLPAKDRLLIVKAMKRWLKEDARGEDTPRKPEHSTIEDMLMETCNEENGFVIYCETNWQDAMDDALDGLEYDEKRKK